MAERRLREAKRRTSGGLAEAALREPRPPSRLRSPIAIQTARAARDQLLRASAFCMKRSKRGFGVEHGAPARPPRLSRGLVGTVLVRIRPTGSSGETSPQFF